MNRLLDIREEKDLNQDQLAKIMGKSRQSISRYKLETATMSNDILIKFANYFNISIDYILYNTDERAPYKLEKANINRLKELRCDKGLTQSDIAKLFSLTQTQYSKYELSERSISYSLLIRFSDFYNTSIDYILGRTNEIKKISDK